MHHGALRLYRFAGAPARIAVDAIRGFARRRSTLSAAAIAFFALMSFTPLMLVVGSVAALILGRSDEALLGAEQFLAQYVPVDEAQLAHLCGIRPGASLSVGGLSLLFVLWTASSAFSVTYDAIRHAGGLATPFVRRRLTSLALVLTLALVTLVGMFAVSGVPLLRSLMADGPNEASVWLEVLRALIVAGVLAAIYRLAGGARVSLLAASVGGGSASVLWALGKLLFWHAIASNVQWGAVYGTVAVTVTVLLWVYYSACILLLGAEVVFAFEREAAAEAEAA